MQKQILVAKSCRTVLRPPWTIPRQSPLSMEFSRQEYWSWLLLPFPRDLPDLGTEPMAFMSLHQQIDQIWVQGYSSQQHFCFQNSENILSLRETLSKSMYPQNIAYCVLIKDGIFKETLQYEGKRSFQVLNEKI